jgi:hypothetical protein
MAAISSTGEHVVQHERDPCRGSQRVQHDEQRAAHRVGRHRLLLWAVMSARVPGVVGHLLADEFLPSRRAGPQHVQADARHDRPLPSGEVLHAVDVGPGETQPALLDGVLGLAP